MTSAEEFARMLESLYGAAVEPAQWPAFLEQLAHATGSPAAAILSVRVTNGLVSEVEHTFNMDPSFKAVYEERFRQANPFVNSHTLPLMREESCGAGEPAGTQRSSSSSARIAPPRTTDPPQSF